MLIKEPIQLADAKTDSTSHFALPWRIRERLLVQRTHGLKQPRIDLSHTGRYEPIAKEGIDSGLEPLAEQAL